MRSGLSLLTAVLAASLTVACATDGGNADAQRSNHTQGNPTSATYEWLWSNESREEFEAIRRSKSSSVAEALPSSHPLVARLQHWTDTFDSALRRSHPTSLKNVPKPIIVVLKDAAPGAWVTSVMVRWNVPMKHALNEVGAHAKADLVDVVAIEPAGLARRSNATTFERRFDQTMLAELVSFANAGFSHCRLGLVDGAVTFDEACVSVHGNAAEGKALAYNAMTRHVSITSSLIFDVGAGQDGELALIATIAHELGHYYRAHGSMPTDTVNYFYSLDGGDEPKQPTLDPRYLEQTETVRKKLREGRFNFNDENAFMADKNLGFYTFEQEADELSLELLALAGVEPESAIDLLFALLKKHGGGDTTWEQCSRLRARGFKDDAGRWTTVPVGPISHPHHSFCFRVFNLQREMEAHHYQVAPALASPPGPAWTELVELLRQDVPGGGGH